MFEDVATESEFDAIYALQALTNPRILDELGDMALIDTGHIPFGIKGCSYATAPFTHLNKDGSRFSDGSFGVLYLADKMKTAIAETRYHQEKLLTAIKGLHYDTIVMRGLACQFSAELADLRVDNAEDMASNPIYCSEDYTHSHACGIKHRKTDIGGLHYTSVRNPFLDCYALFSPQGVTEIIQSSHYEYIWDGERIATVRAISTI